MPLQKMKLTGVIKKDRQSFHRGLEDESIPADIPKGFFAVYVGDDFKRYVIPLKYLKHQVFKSLLSRAEDEFGYSSEGAIRLPCDTVFFDHLLWLLGREDPSVQSSEIAQMLKCY